MENAVELCSYLGVNYFKVSEDGIIKHKAQRLRHDVYLEMDYIPEPYPNGIIPDTCAEDEYIVALADNNVVGTMRLTPTARPNELLAEWKGNLKEDSQFLLQDVERGKSVVTGALAVNKGFVERKISWGIYKSSLLYSLMKPITHWVIAIDARALRVMDIVGWKIYRIGNPIVYMGSKTVLCVIVIEEQMKSFAAKNNSFYSFLVS